jgi:putative membrane protein
VFPDGVVAGHENNVAPHQPLNHLDEMNAPAPGIRGASDAEFTGGVVIAFRCNSHRLPNNIRIASIGSACGLLWSAGTAVALAQTAPPPEVPATLNAIDFNFVGQANLGAPFQVDSGRLAETKATSAAIRNYAHLMVTTHIPVVDALNVILKQKNIMPSSTLLHGAYDAMIFTLKADRGAAFDRNYVNGQVEYQKGNAALFEQEIQNGADPELKEFVRQTLPKIVDHLQRAEKLAADGRLASK